MLPSDTELHLVDNIDAAWAMKRWLGDQQRDVLGLDSETTGLTWLKPNDGLRLVQIGDHKTGWAVPWEQWGGAVMECLNAWDGQIALHNAAFDIKFMKKYAGWKPPWERLHDTMIMSRIMRPGKPAGLKPLSVQLVDSRADAGADQLKKAMSDNGWGWDTVPVELEAFWAYGALDPVLTAHLYTQFRADLAFPEVYDLEMAALRICSEMEERGARIDLEYCVAKEKQLDEFVETAKKYGKENYGISISSSPQLVKYFQSVGAEITERTPSGAPSANADQLELFLSHNDSRVSSVAKLALDARKADKIRASYFESFIRENVNGFVHPQINTMGAITGRMSIQTPALQTLPRGQRVVRDAFIPRDGNMILTSDLDQVEFRLFSCFSQDQGLINMFKTADATGSDAFTQIGREIYADPSMEKSDPRRAIIKTYVYSKLFGAAIEKQAQSAGVSVEVMREFADTLNAQYPMMDVFQQNMINLVGERARKEGEGWIVTPTTKRRLPIERDKAYKAINYVIQSSAADIFKRNLVKLDAAGLGEYLLVPVHDEIVMDVPADIVDDVAPLVKQCMTTDTDEWALPLTADFSGPYDRWGTKYA